uniref:Ig-like domain-containing protein n=1 Tax=Suricata suricatta TaxID=37032 RepID=A0A673TBA8_SURSU
LSSLTVLLFLTFSLCTGLSRGEKVEQHHSTLSVQEGRSSVISCTYSDSTSDYFPWYKQEVGKGPQLIIAIRSNQDGRLECTLNSKERHSSLHIRASRQEDSATYLCAVEAYGVGQLSLSPTESLLNIGSTESFPFLETLTKNLSDDTCFCLLLRILWKCGISLS